MRNVYIFPSWMIDDEDKIFKIQMQVDLVWINGESL